MVCEFVYSTNYAKGLESIINNLAIEIVMKFRDKKVLVIGAGASGKSAKEFLESRGASVTLYDDKENLLDHDSLLYEDFDLVILSPGVSINHPLAQKFESKMISELALGFSVPHKKKVAVTGTNGKTSVVNLIQSAIGDKRGILVGNSGVPVSSVSAQIKSKLPVTEVSSFMLECQLINHEKQIQKIAKFRPKIAVILNISQDHLDRHGTMENYIAHKAAITKYQKRCDKLILNYDNVHTRGIETRAKKLFFSTTSRVRGAYVEDGFVYLNLRGRAKKVFKLSDLNLFKQHDIENFLATFLVCHLLKIPKKNLENLRAIEEHRIQYVTTIGQTEFYNDSKATNIAATLAACKSFKLPVNLIIGGVDKGQNFESMWEDLPQNVERVFVYGESKHSMQNSAQTAGYDSIELCEDMYDAIKRATEHGMGAKVVLLSPACASFDEFLNYEDRGNKFAEFVKSMGDSEEADAEIQ